ncbi:MAG: Trk system potassium transporter TrkA, partial [Hyphomonadaceae bacterium]|nr:Trk system potassium transporter TrkA [Hyphomonadaceae bacterium]
MQVIVCGAGRVGQGIARRLIREQHNVILVDENAMLIDQVSTDLDVRGVVGNGAHPNVLQRAGAEDCEMMIAVTQHDEINMVICQVAKSLFKVQTTIARVRSKVYQDKRWKDLFSNDAIPVDLSFSPEVSVGEAIVERFRSQGAVMSAKFADGRIQLVAIDMEKGNPLLDTNLDQIAGLFPDLSARIIGIGRGGRIQAPRSNDTLHRGDRAFIAVKANHLTRLNAILGREEKDSRLVTLIGAGNVGIYVANALTRLPGVRVRIVEMDEARANSAAQALRRAVVIRGDGLNPDVLEEAGGARSDFVISLTSDDKTNLLSCGIAKRLGVKRTMALVNEPYLAELHDMLDIDAIIDPRALTVSEILKRVRRGRIMELRSLEDGRAEVVEG